MTRILTVANARCRIGRQALLKIDHFEIVTGQHWCLFGPNGAGKSCIAKLVSGQMRETGSYVRYDSGFDPGRDLHIVSFEEQQRLWQRDDRFDISEYSESAQDQGTQVEQLIRSSREACGQDEALFQQLLDQLDMVELRNRGIRFLSSGQVRKALLAKALYAHRDDSPQLIILDDPLESIDRESRRRIESCIERFLTAANASLLLSRRQQDIPARVTHVGLVNNLALLQTGRREQVLSGAEYQQLLAVGSPLPSQLPPLSALTHQDPLPAGPLIELRNVNASYGEQKVLNDVNWCMDEHHHVLIEGPNGCGKSTLLSLIDGENHKGYGQEVILFGRRKGSGEAVWDIKKRFGLVSNELHNKYVKGWRVLEVVVSGFFDSVGLYDDSGSTEKILAQRWLSAFGVAALEKTFYHELSFGQQRLVLLARAMVKSPAVLILDEPCVGLDDYHRGLILHILDLIAAQTDTRIIYVSHVVGEQPQCINQKLYFVVAGEGGFTLQVSAAD